MSALTSMLVRDQKVPVRKIEEAIQRQVIAGGGLDTVLLEARALPENVIASYCAAVHGFAPATRAECMDVPRDVVRTVPSEVAERHRLVPLSFDGNRLAVAVAQPLPFEVEQQLGFLLGVTVEQRIAPEVRIAAGLQQHFGVEMVPRMRRLAKKLLEQSAGATVFVEPLAPVEGDKAWPEPATEGTGTKRFGTVQEPTDGARVSVSGMVKLDGAQKTGTQAPPSPVSSPPVSSPVSSPSASPAAPEASEQASPDVRPVSEPSPEVVARLRNLSAPPAPKRVSIPRSARLVRHRGPLTAQRAVELLKDAEERDEILEVTFAFFRQFFDVSAVFVIHEGEAEGLDIAGPGVDLNRFQRLGIPLSEPSAFRTASEGPVPVVSALDANNLERRITKELVRSAQTPALILPISIRKRVVLMFYGDRSGEFFDLSDVPEPVAFAPRVSEAFQQMILRRKIRGANKSADKPSRAQAKDAPLPEAKPPQVLVRSEPMPIPKAQDDAPAVPEPSDAPAELPDDESHVRWSEPPPPAPSRRSRGRDRSKPFEVLGVPRSAPPPPMPGDQPLVSLSSLPPPTVPSVAPPLEDDDDDFPEVTVEEGEAESDPPKKRVGSYVMRGGTTEVVRRSQHLRGEKEAPSASDEVEINVDGDDWRTSDDLPASKEPKEREKRNSAAPLPLTSTLRRPSRPGSQEERIDVAKVPKPSPASIPPSEQPISRGKRDTQPETPSVIIEMDANIESTVEDLRFSGPDEPEAAVQAVLQHGEAALPVLVREFPGPLFFDRSQPHRRLPRGRDISAIGRAIAAFGDLAVPYVISLLNRDEADTRFYAVLLTSEFSHSRLVQPLGDRIFDEDQGVGTLALDVLRTLRPFVRELKALKERLRAEARIPRASLDHRRMALRALGELRDEGAAQLLLTFVEKEPDLSEQALRSLKQLTRQDFGASLSKWRDWLEDNESRHRIEWLIDALSHSNETIRRKASDELKELTHEYYGYHPALSKKEREIAQRKYRRWWKDEGAARFK